MPRKKPFKYEISDLTSDCNEDLYREISNQIPIDIIKHHGGWSASIKDNRAIIKYSWSTYPDACFAHELLHIELELNGLKDPFVWSYEKNISWTDIRFLINQLAHHRMYPKFIEMGFSEEEFLHHNDYQETRSLLKRDISMLEKIHKKEGVLIDGLPFLYPYLVCISPNETNDDVKEYLRRLKQISEPNCVRNAEKIINEWVLSGRMSYCISLAKLFKLGKYTSIGFGDVDDIEKQIKASDFDF
jgi:hypothetical protein